MIDTQNLRKFCVFALCLKKFGLDRIDDQN